MNISGIYSYANMFQGGEVDNKGNRKISSLEKTGGNRNAGPDTVSFSSEALAKYLAMENASDGVKNELEESQSFLSNQSQHNSKKSKKMDSAELLAFLQSDNFAEKAMSYAKSAAIAKATNEDDEDEQEQQDEAVMNMGAKKQSASAKGVDSDTNSIKEQAKKDSESAFVNEKRTDEKEFAADIHKI